MYPYLHLGILNIPMYGLLSTVGFGVAIALYSQNIKRFGFSRWEAVYSAVYCIIGILIGAKFLFFLTKCKLLFVHPEALWEHPDLTLNFLFGGFVFYGGLIGAAVMLIIYCRHFKAPLVKYVDAITPCVPLMHAFGRFGCHFGGCCYGIEYHGPFAVTFPSTGLTAHSGGVPRFPVQLAEAFAILILSGVLYLLFRRGFFGGRLIGIYIVVYAILRFSLEYLRGDIERGSIGIFSTSQWISLALLPLGFFLLFRKQTPDKKETA